MTLGHDLKVEVLPWTGARGWVKDTQWWCGEEAVGCCEGRCGMR